MNIRLSVLRGLAASVGLATALTAAGCGGNLDGGDDAATAAKFPNGPITMLVGQDPGGSTDLIGRALADHASDGLGVPITVQNRPGANGALAAKELAAAKPDGQTVMVFVGSLAYITPLAVAENEAIDITKYDIVTGISQDDYVLVASTKSGFTSIKDIVDAKRPIKFGTTGVGTGSQLSQELLFAQTDVDATAVPFDGGSPTLTAVLGGQVDVASVQLGEAQAQIAAKKVTPIVTFAEKRPSYLPDTPTAVESGYDVPVQQSRAIAVPKGTPAEAVAKLRAAFQEAFKTPEYQDFSAKRMLTANEADGATLTQQWTGSLQKYRDLVAKYKISLGEDK
jgi:tripartite-type tricarboxylate transporter receptor subunit TctC